MQTAYEQQRAAAQCHALRVAQFCTHLCVCVCVMSSGTLDLKREGQAGGFKELDEEEVEAAKKRRQEFESQDM